MEIKELHHIKWLPYTDDSQNYGGERVCWERMNTFNDAGDFIGKTGGDHCPLKLNIQDKIYLIKYVFKNVHILTENSLFL